MEVATIDQVHFNFFAFDLDVKENQARVDLFVFIELDVAPVELEVLCEGVFLLDSVLLCKDLLQIFENLCEFSLFRVVPLACFPNNKPVQYREDELSIEVDKELVDSALNRDFSCILWMSLFFAFNQHFNVGFGFLVFVRILEVVVGVGENEVILISFFLGQ
jgi:hypothetical protein